MFSKIILAVAFSACFMSFAFAGNGLTFEPTVEGKKECEEKASEYKPVRHEGKDWRKWAETATKSPKFTGCVRMNTARSFQNTSDNKEYGYVYLKDATFLLHTGRWLHDECFNDTDYQIHAGAPAPAASPASAPVQAAPSQTAVAQSAAVPVPVFIQPIVLPAQYQQGTVVAAQQQQQSTAQQQVNCERCSVIAVAQKVKEEASAFCGIRTDYGLLFAIQRTSSGAAEFRRVLRVAIDGSPVASYPTGPGQRGHSITDPKFKIEVGGDCNAAQLYFENNWHNLVLAFGQAGVQIGTRSARLLGPVLAAKY